jgi:hypothetical protein
MSKGFTKDLTGQRFGRWAVVSFFSSPKSTVHWTCCCDCGTVRVVTNQSLLNGRSQSCGCLAFELAVVRSLKHGQAGVTGKRSRAYTIWAGMLARAHFGNHPSYFTHYAPRGIGVAEEWLKFDRFYADMGAPPEGTELDRRDNDLGYSKNNCRWATRSEQMRNTRGTRRVIVNGTVKNIPDLCDELGVNRAALRNRAWRLGGSYAKALDAIGYHGMEDAA